MLYWKNSAIKSYSIVANSSATWLIVEPTYVGHRLTYLIEIVRGAVLRKIHVIVAVGDDAAADCIAKRLDCTFAGKTVSLIRVRGPSNRSLLRGPADLVQRTIRWWYFLSRAYREAIKYRSVDFVFIPYLDDSLFAFSILGSPFGKASFAGLTMRQRFHLREMGVAARSSLNMTIKRRLFLRVLRLKRLQRVYVIDETLQTYFARNHPSLSGKLYFIPDPIAPIAVTPKVEARIKLGLRVGALIVLAFGFLDSRKGIAKLLTWAAGPNAVPTMHVVLAGIMNQDIERLLSIEAALNLYVQNRLTVFNRYLEDEEQQLLFSAADVIWLGYDDVDLMSGVLVTAAHFRKAVLFSDRGLIAHYAKRHGSESGISLPTSIDLSGLPADIKLRFFDQSSESSESLRDHSWENACRCIFDS